MIIILLSISQYLLNAKINNHFQRKIYKNYYNYSLVNNKTQANINFLNKIETEEIIFGTVLTSLFISSFFIDQSVRNYVQREVYGGSNTFSKILYNAGDKEYFFIGILALYSSNIILQNRYYHDSLILSLQSLLMTQGITELSKKTFKRARPRKSPDDAFDFGIKGESFFSGHSSGAWSYLTVIAGRHPEVKWLAYSFAACVSLSRIYEDAHWTSDVILGALVGYSIGRLTLRFDSKYARRINILPYINQDEKNIMLQFRF